MNTPLLFDFVVHKANKTIEVTREFAGQRSLVWKAWTEAQTKSMHFEEGGRWLYAMVGPQGEKHWSIADY